MKVLVVGNGGREHALAWKLAQSPQVNQVFVAPGNAGTAQENKCENIDIAPTDINALLQFAKQVDLTIVGPEAPLALGIVDQFQAAGHKIFGPSQACAQLEASKAFSKQFMQEHAIPTAEYASFTELNTAIDFIKQHGAPIVVKADGLAAGKGVIVAQTEAEAIAAVEDMLSANKFGDAGAKVVIEAFLNGIEASYIVMVDGEHILPMASSQDHKARDDGDRGPNTGGMGAYSPANIVTPELEQLIINTVIQPVVNGMQQRGTPYTGFLYAGLMIEDNSIKVLEFNCRFGDPETQPIMLRLNSDLAELCMAACDGKLNILTANWHPEAALGVVMASLDYPYTYPKGETITGLTDVSEAKVFHAGTLSNGEDILTNGGRVLCVTALGKDVAAAQQNAYQALKPIDWPSVFYRTDIGFKALASDQLNN